MAGMLPGVEVARRRKAHHHGYYNSHSPAAPRPPSSVPSSMDEAALQARRRLQQKLGGFTSRLENYNQKSKTRNVEINSILKKEKLFYMPKLLRSDSHKEVCSICLEDFNGIGSLINLPCRHRYHSECLLPWLANNSHCPYCRTHVHT